MTRQQPLVSVAWAISNLTGTETNLDVVIDRIQQQLTRRSDLRTALAFLVSRKAPPKSLR